MTSSGRVSSPNPPNKYALLAAVAVSSPLSIVVETTLRKNLLGRDFQDIREYLRPTLTPVAWAAVGVTTLSIGLGFVVYRKILRHGLAKLGERAADPNAVARKELEAMFLSTSVPQVPTLLATILFQWGASFTPVAVCIGLSTVGVLLLGLVGPKRG